MQQFCQWFDLDHITPSAAQFNSEKLNWLNAHYLRRTDTARLLALVGPRLAARGVTVTAEPSLAAIIELHRERVTNLNELADVAEVFYRDLQPKAELLAKHLSSETLPMLREFAAGLAGISWEAAAIGALIKQCVARHGLKMPRLAMPLRVLLTGLEQTPSVDALIAVFPRSVVIERLARAERVAVSPGSPV